MNIMFHRKNLLLRNNNSN